MAYRNVYPRAQKCTNEAADVVGSKLEAIYKVPVRLEELLAEAAKSAILTRTGLINCIAHDNGLCYELLTAGHPEGLR